MTRPRHPRAAILGTLAAALCTITFTPAVANAATAPEYGLGTHAASPQGISGGGRSATSTAVSPQGISGSGKIADPQGIQGTGK